MVPNDKVWKSLQQLPEGMRSRYISEAGSRPENG